MRSLVRLSFGAAMALALAACSSSTDNGGTTTPTPDASTPNKDSGGGTPGSDSGPGPGDSGNPGTDAGTCSLSNVQIGTATCHSCLQSTCCDAVFNCVSDSACLKTNNCIASCDHGQLPNDAGGFDAGGDGGALTACVNQCLNGVSTTVQQELQAQVTCLTGPCASSCQ